jgi:hypothetical protein
MRIWLSSMNPGFLPANNTRKAIMKLAIEHTIGTPIGRYRFILDMSSREQGGKGKRNYAQRE